MAESSSSSPFWIDDFVKFSKIIALELESKDIEELKFSIQDRIPKSRIAEIETGIQLISLLKEYRLLSENNLDYLIELLAESRRIDLTNKVIEYRNNLDVVRNAPQAEMEERLPAQDGAQWETVAEANYPEIGVCQELVACVGVQDLRTICPTKAAKKVAGILQLDKSSFKDPPADVRQKCRAFCMHLKKEGRPDIIRELRTKLPSGMTGPLPDEDMLYQELEFITRRDLTRALCGNDLWKGLASELAVPGEHIGYYERQPNPAKAVLDDQSDNTFDVGKLYDLLVQCDAGALADKYL